MNKYISGIKKTVSKIGFTLIELMVSIAITSLVLSGVYGTFLIGKNFWSSQSAAIDVQDNARRALDSMARELMFALDIEPLSTNISNSIAFKIPVYCQGDGIFIDGHYVESVINSSTYTKDAGAYLSTDFDTDPSTGQIRLASADASRLGRRIVYSVGGLNNSQLMRTVENADGTQAELPRVLANNISEIRFRSKNLTTARNVILIEADVAKKIFPGWAQPENIITLRTSVRARN
jgi:prepilin-type N-terminal cleavage/methylation domain-containing protein